MPINYKLAFGAYNFPAGMVPAGRDGGQELGEQARAHVSGSATGKGRTTDKIFTLNGGFGVETLDEWYAVADAMMAAIYSGPQSLWYGTDQRYYKEAQLFSESLSAAADGRLHGKLANVSISFKASLFPEAFGTTLYTPAIALASGVGSVNYSLLQGTAPTLPVWTITIGSGGTGAISFSNTTTGETCLLKRPGGVAWQAGDVVTLNRDGSKATLNGVAIVGIFDFQIPTLTTGINALSILPVAGATATVASLAVGYYGRYR